MPFTLNHPHISRKLRLVVDPAGNDTVIVRCNDSARFRVRYPGRLLRGARASYNVRVLVGDVSVDKGAGGPGRPRGGRWQSQARTLNLTLKIHAPDGREFTAENVTLADLARYRDARGVTQGEWTCSVTGQSAPHFVSDGDSQVTLGNSSLTIAVREQVPSKSAPPLVSGLLGASGTQSFAFDLFRIGTFNASVRPFVTFLSTPWRGTLQLKDPSGQVVASSSSSRLSVPVTLATLDTSRGPAGQVLPWTLEVVTRSAGRAGSRISAQVTASPRLRTATLQQRIDTLIGPGGNKLQVFGDNKGGTVLLRLRILDELSAETIDMHGLLDAAIRGNPQDAGVDTVHADVKMNQTYTLAQTGEGLGYGMRLIANQVKLNSLSVSVGASRRIQPAVPALRISAVTEGNLLVRVGGFTLATVKVRGNRLDLELGFKLDANGTVVPEVWVADDFLDVDVHWTAAVAAGIISFGLLTLGAAGVAEIIEETKTNEFQEDLRDAVAGMAARIPQVMAVILGDDFTYTGLRLEGDDIVFDHIAPLEPDPRPSSIYRGVVGRSVSQLGPDAWTIRPLQLGNTWAADNLTKIDHVVVVMMENRSFDHVLGYRAQLPGGGSNGLSNDLLQLLQANGYALPRLAQSALTVKTQFPIAVGHELHDVAEQLEHRLAGPDGRPIVSPQGYVANFQARHDKLSAADKARVKLHDVLGWYDGNDLPFYRYLAQNYAWCEQYYCSHAGPTLPNRMFSLTGDVQYDRAGEAIVDNNDGDNFYLSRALTIYDLFTRKGLDWRVYESFPSVTMLRMFARYATEERHIVPISRLAQDVAAGNLPPLTVIEPAMHHFPQNDDHPVADMLNGQAFLKGVYDTLRSNPALWRKTLLVITYDEHGGFYDHAVPPIADLRDVRQIDKAVSGTLLTRGAPSSTAGALATRVVTGDGADLAARQAGAALAVDEALRAGQASATLDAAARAGVTPASRQDVLTPYGVRVPTFLVSPWVPAGKGPETVLDHCSILKTVLARFIGPSAPFLSDRVAASRSFDGFLSASTPRLDVGPAPAAKAVLRGKSKPGQRIVTEPMSRAAMRRGNVDYHDLTGWLARQLGR